MLRRSMLVFFGSVVGCVLAGYMAKESGMSIKSVFTAVLMIGGAAGVVFHGNSDVPPARAAPTPAHAETNPPARAPAAAADKPATAPRSECVQNCATCFMFAFMFP